MTTTYCAYWYLIRTDNGPLNSLMSSETVTAWAQAQKERNHIGYIYEVYNTYSTDLPAYLP